MAGFDPLTDRQDVTRILGVQLQQSALQENLTVREALQLYSAFYPAPADWRQPPSISPNRRPDMSASTAVLKAEAPHRP
ncbi:hypothetical protein [Nonomuraea cypriaca]|uniref:hypothetical protein n=1 Tax=Nonomuraea cypriaca TaxID=1187855 RepID=UPI001A9C8AC7|nr:hypothetical protein [Nonomuraea cypriaca]